MGITASTSRSNEVVCSYKVLLYMSFFALLGQVSSRDGMGLGHPGFFALPGQVRTQG
jgi:hypothetical protein